MAALAPADLASAEGARARAGATVAEFGGGGGSIINVASIAARFGARFVGQVPHGSAKGRVLTMTRTP
jgi:NAD(P)-dependent dehydrogenase (short-subunit alcohol dehydrogenase family)